MTLDEIEQRHACENTDNEPDHSCASRFSIVFIFVLENAILSMIHIPLLDTAPPDS